MTESDTDDEKGIAIERKAERLTRLGVDQDDHLHFYDRDEHRIIVTRDADHEEYTADESVRVYASLDVPVDQLVGTVSLGDKNLVDWREHIAHDDCGWQRWGAIVLDEALHTESLDRATGAW